MARLNVGHRLAHHHWVAQLLQGLHLVLDHLLDERIKVDGERKEDLEVSYCQVLSVELQEHLKFFLIPKTWGNVFLISVRSSLHYDADTHYFLPISHKKDSSPEYY